MGIEPGPSTTSRVAPRLSARRKHLQFCSIFDRYELESSFVRKQLMNNSHVSALMKSVALGFQPEDKISATSPPWKEIATDLISNEACSKLEELRFRLGTLKLLSTHTSNDNLTKLVLETQDGKQLETCIMRFGGILGRQRAKESVRGSRPRVTICVSSQIGCRMDCSFCETGTMGLQGNLTCGEIIEQAVIANAVERQMRIDANGGTLPAEDLRLNGIFIRNVTFMGMGEPTDNYSEVIMAIRMLTSGRLFALSPSRVTLSTVGAYPDRIRRLIEDVPKISLALSLHAPNQELRQQIVRSATGVSLTDLLDACYAFVDNQKTISNSSAKKQVLMIEYTLIKGINDSDDHGRELAGILRAEDTTVNFIPYNPTNVAEQYQPPSAERITAIANIVQQAGIRCYVRQEFGQEVGGACGQLAVNQKSKKQTSPALLPVAPDSSAADPSEESKGVSYNKSSSVISHEEDEEDEVLTDEDSSLEQWHSLEVSPERIAGTSEKLAPPISAVAEPPAEPPTAIEKSESQTRGAVETETVPPVLPETATSGTPLPKGSVLLPPICPTASTDANLPSTSAPSSTTSQPQVTTQSFASVAPPSESLEGRETVRKDPRASTDGNRWLSVQPVLSQVFRQVKGSMQAYPAAWLVAGCTLSVGTIMLFKAARRSRMARS